MTHAWQEMWQTAIIAVATASGPSFAVLMANRKMNGAQINPNVNQLKARRAWMMAILVVPLPLIWLSISNLIRDVNSSAPVSRQAVFFISADACCICLGITVFLAIATVLAFVEIVGSLEIFLQIHKTTFDVLGDMSDQISKKSDRKRKPKIGD